MTEIRFYHLQRRTLEQVLPQLLDIILKRGHRIIVKTGTKERAEALNSHLWTYSSDSFLPHGGEKDGFEADQPIFLTSGDSNPNKADMLILSDGAQSEQVSNYKMCCEIFDGNDDEAVSAARTRWKAYKDEGHELSYFQQDEDGRWEKKN